MPIKAYDLSQMAKCEERKEIDDESENQPESIGNLVNFLSEINNSNNENGNSIRKLVNNRINVISNNRNENGLRVDPVDTPETTVVNKLLNIHSETEIERMRREYRTNKIEPEIIRPFVMEAFNQKGNAMVDNGAATAYMKPSLMKLLSLRVIDAEDIQAALGNSENCIVTEPVEITFNGRTFMQNFIVAEHQTSADIIAGREMLGRAGIGLSGLVPLTSLWSDKQVKDDEYLFSNHTHVEGIETTEEVRELLRDLLEANDATKDLFISHPLGVYDAPLVDKINIESNTFNFIAKKFEPGVRKKLKELVERGIIRIVDASYPLYNIIINPLLATGKRDMDGNYTDVRVCLDTRKSNKYLLKDKFTTPKIKEMLTNMAGKCYYTIIDCVASFHQIPTTTRAQRLLCFVWENVTYTYLGAPFGTCTVVNTSNCKLILCYCKQFDTCQYCTRIFN